MGQIVTAVIFGCAVPDSVALRSDGPPWDGLLERWEKVVTKRHAAEYKANWRRAQSTSVPDHDEGDIIGFWVAGVAEYDNDSGERITGPIDLRKLVATKRARRAAERWGVFAEWAAGEGVKLKGARLHIVQTEVA